MSQYRDLTEVVVGQPASDGAGVRLTRVFGGRDAARFDPFLMLDEFDSDSAEDYIGGFPSHPHRGFETVTYMLEGRMLHEDHLGNQGLLGPGDVQWMTAGRGIIHSEMPQQDHGTMRGFQLWLNLPAADKMQPAHYRDLPATAMPECELSGGGQLKLIAGRLEHQGQSLTGPITGGATEPLYIDLQLPENTRVTLPVPATHRVLSYVYEGNVTVHGAARAANLRKGQLGRYGEGDSVRLEAGQAGARLLLLAGRPIGEPIVQYGPFVMNTEAEIHQAIKDYQLGQLTA
ncbi:putative quercetin 2,3-dioxygenase [Halopseudomonas oceani]|uniref:Quercetin 2,3-dioxygenase n=1 Tax=Halopseudomonas oceani TaxID=1708783 RepID=A0A2P4EQL1_9GAMM|nr:pirin family protein [Halopseudomonas oceani]POB00911.1 quercetin 2,3-dioxygenase [Halopseudomonas oceani]GGE46188.1 putative quercetin 2,3-dioxygenase [Halopseudomonas oceani]